MLLALLALQNTFLTLCFTLRTSKVSHVCLSICLSLFLSLSFSLFFSIGQTSSAQAYTTDIFTMGEGTEVQILSENFLSVVSTGQIVQNKLELNNSLVPTQKVQIIFSNAQTGEVEILPAIVSFQGNDLLILTSSNISGGGSSDAAYISLYNWLATSKGILLTTVPNNP